MGEDKLRTPHYKIEQLVDVYEPSEDTFLFIDALEDDLSFIKSRNPVFMLEIGSGSGLISIALGSYLPICCFATDINMNACIATKSTGQLNKLDMHSVCMDLASQFKPSSFDILLFNPPYVVTDPEETHGHGLNRAWAGGINGRQIIDKLLPQISSLLSHMGVFYLLLLKENDPDDVINLLKLHGFQHKIIKQRKIIGEYLYIVRFIKTIV